uniref:(northern house mosquito) hypothetical protein n=1 Tax=Culex pipiens TaxID=7175 RepID=A0A8D8I7F7_CULPI
MTYFIATGQKVQLHVADLTADATIAWRHLNLRHTLIFVHSHLGENAHFVCGFHRKLKFGRISWTVRGGFCNGTQRSSPFDTNLTIFCLHTLLYKHLHLFDNKTLHSLEKKKQNNFF